MKPAPAKAKVATVSAPAKPGRPACPLCNGHLHPIENQFIDSLTNLFLPGRRVRFCCRSLGCGWEGKLRLRKIEGAHAANYDERRLVLAPSLLGNSSAQSSR